jgi:hypothetical protein
MAVPQARGSIAGLVCLTALTLCGCGGSDATDSEVLTIGTGTVPTETGSAESTLRSEDFSFVLPTGWVERASSSSETYGQPASAASVSPISPGGTARNSLVLVLAYDVTGQPPESPTGPRLWFDWYAQTNDAEISEAPGELALDGAAALQGRLTWKHLGNPVEVRIVRAVRGGFLYLIQCQAEPADRAAIAAGCAAILGSFRAT